MRLKVICNNLYEVHCRSITVWFSYETPIAIKRDDNDKVWLRPNKWGSTTGRHMTYIRQNYEVHGVPEEIFEDELMYAF